MKRFLVVLLSLGLIMAFSASAFAVTPDFAGQYYVWGRYYGNPSFLKDSNNVNATTGVVTPTGKSNSASEWDQRLRLFMRLKVAEGLSITTRMDAMEFMWGQDNKVALPGTNISANNNLSLNFEQAWATFATGIGTFNVGIKSARPYGWGTRFQDATGTAPGIEWSNSFGPSTLFFDFYKQKKGDINTALLNSGNPTLALKQTDQDSDLFDVGMTHKFTRGDAGLLVSYFRNASTRTPAGASPMTTAANLQPYVKLKFGPVNVEAEGYWLTGKTENENFGATPDVKIKAQGAYVNGRYNMGPAYVGALLLYNSGDDPTTAAATGGDREGGVNSTFGYGQDKAMWGDFITLNMGFQAHLYPPAGAGDATTVDPGGRIDNVWLYQVYGGYSPTKKLDFFGRYSIMKADQDGRASTAAASWQSKDYGSELDLLLTYKIYDALTYNVGAAYLWTGDWFKGTNARAQVDNTYYLVHYIDLNF